MHIDNYSKKIKAINPAKPTYLAFLDILGFSKLVLSESHDEIRALYQGVIRTNLDLTLTEVTEQGKSDSEWLKTVYQSNDYFDIEPQLADVKLSVTAISDSIILSTQDDTFRSLITLIAAVRNLMAKLFYFGFPLRGAIAHGEVTSDWQSEETNRRIIHHQILGKPIIHAAELEKIQNWSGCALHSSVIKSTGMKLIGFMPNFLTLYEVPINNSKHQGETKQITELMPIVSWPCGMSDDAKKIMNAKSIREAFSAHNKQIDKSVEEKVLNTIRYYESAFRTPTVDEMFEYCGKHIPHELNESIQMFMAHEANHEQA